MVLCALDKSGLYSSSRSKNLNRNIGDSSSSKNGMATVGDRSALSSLIKGAPLSSTTSIELLQIGRSLPDTAVPIFHQIFEDEIVSYVALGERSEQTGHESNSASTPPGLDKPALQIL